jgi:sulfide:quinone oxidoreductase
MAGKRLVIVGGGVGGTIVANQVVRGLAASDPVSVTLISKDRRHMYQPGLLYVAIGAMRTEELYREEKSLLDPRVRWMNTNATRIDLAGRTVETEAGSVPYDYLVIATGSVPSPELVPGMAEGAHVFYTEAGALRLQQALASFEGGRVLLTVSVPHKCPVAPLEITFMLDDWFARRGLRDKVEIMYTYPIGRVHSLEPVAEWAAPEFDRRGIRYETFVNVSEVDPQKKVVRTMEGSEIAYDLLIAIPPHQGAQVIRDSGIGDGGGWLPTDRHTLKLDGHDDVFVLGDATNLPISKAGSTAHYEADVVAENLLGLLSSGRPGRRYDGKVLCFIETGLDKGSYIWFNYQTPPKPAAPSTAIHWMKLAYNRLYWLTPKGVL